MEQFIFWMLIVICVSLFLGASAVVFCLAKISSTSKEEEDREQEAFLREYRRNH